MLFRYKLITLMVLIFVVPWLRVLAERDQQIIAWVAVLNREKRPVSTITDGDAIQLRYVRDRPATGDLRIDFQLNPGGFPAGQCTIPNGQERCETELIASLGWYWDADGAAARFREVEAVEGAQATARTPLLVSPRPVVFVHGFSATWEAWANYLGPDGYLARDGLSGFAVGDGQVPGTLNTGNIAAPTSATNTIAQNAAVLGEYIQAVKTLSGAQMVDLVAHSMGGLISRAYIDQVMKERDISQLIMLGSPMAGTDCAVLPAALGLYLPAVLELRPSYVTGIFNQQVFHRHSVPFRALAGIPILRPVEAPCTSVPSDLVVSQQSVGAIPLDLTEQAVIHTELNTSEQVYHSYVLPLLQSSPGSFTAQPDTTPPQAEEETLQFTHVYTGHVTTDSSQEIAISIEPGVALANFALFDETHSISVTVRGASGAVINLSAEKNGLIIVDDPATLVYLGYGFENPRPGVWRVTLQATPRTPSQGADFAITAQFQGGVSLNAQADPLVPAPGEAVNLSAGFDTAISGLQIVQASAAIHSPTGLVETLPLVIQGNQAQAAWKPEKPGLYGIDLLLKASLPEGVQIERAAYLSVEAQPPLQPLRVDLTLAGLLCLLALAGAVLVVVVLRVLSRQNTSPSK